MVEPQLEFWAPTDLYGSSGKGLAFEEAGNSVPRTLWDLSLLTNPVWLGNTDAGAAAREALELTGRQAALPAVEQVGFLPDRIDAGRAEGEGRSLEEIAAERASEGAGKTLE